MNATTRHATEIHTSQGRSFSEKSEAPAEPAAISSVPKGRQQLKAASRLASDAPVERRAPLPEPAND